VRYEHSGGLDVVDLKGQLWRLEQPAWIETGLKGYAFRMPALRPFTDASYIENDGKLCVMPGYIYDGSSIPLLGRWLDRRVSQWPGLVHDFFYEGLRAGKVDPELREPIDGLYRDLLVAFGAYKATAHACYAGLRLFGAGSAARAPEYPERMVK
jgi:hypothetical protein